MCDVDPRADPDARITLANDMAAPVPPSMIPEGCDVVATTFPRVGGMYGIKCTRGVLQTMRALMHHDSDRVVKIDCDTILHHTDWLQEKADYVAAERWIPWVPCGCCIAITRRACDAALAALARRVPMDEGQWSWPEDEAIYGLLCDAGVKRYLWHHAMGQVVGLQEDLRTRHLLAGAVHCGEQLPGGGRCDRRVVVDRMVKLLAARKKYPLGHEPRG